MNDEPKLGTIQVIDLTNRFGIITEEREGVSKVASESMTFDLDEATQYLQEGQLVQFLKVDSDIGPRATRIAAVKTK